MQQILAVHSIVRNSDLSKGGVVFTTLGKQLDTLSRLSGLTAFERDFVAHCRGQLQQSKPLPHRARSVIAEIWKRHRSQSFERTLLERKTIELNSLSVIEAEIQDLKAQLHAATLPEIAEYCAEQIAQAQADLNAVLLNLQAIDRLLSLAD